VPCSGCAVYSTLGRAWREIKVVKYFNGSSIVGKYLLGWVFGVPVVVLVIIYMLFN
jgi:hypothetical protein